MIVIHCTESKKCKMGFFLGKEDEANGPSITQQFAVVQIVDVANTKMIQFSNLVRVVGIK